MQGPISNQRFSVIIAATLMLGTLVCSVPAQDVKPVVVATVTKAEVRSGQRIVGTVQPLRTSTIGSALDGRLSEFLVREGDPVDAGQTLAKLLTETLAIERSAADAELKLAMARLAELENGSRPEDIAEAAANRENAAAALQSAQSNLRRMEALALRAATSELELDDARQQVNAARFALQATTALFERIKTGPRMETITQAKAEVELQRQRLKLIDDRISKSEIKSPFNGFVSVQFTDVGAWIKQGDPIVEIIQLDIVEIQAPVTAEAVVHLRRGDRIRVEFPELPDELFVGEIDRIVPVAAERSRTFPVQIRLTNRIENGFPVLFAGMLARVDVPVGNQQPLPLVPKDALVLNGNDRSVFVFEPDSDSSTGTVRKVPVQLGVAVDDRIQVVGAIEQNDLVVIEGNERLLPNSRVQVISDKAASGQQAAPGTKEVTGQ